MSKLTSPQAYREELKQRIIDVAMKEFWQKGVKAVKMDDIANDLTISKRTLYETYENKEVLLLEVLKHHKQQQHNHMAEFAEKVNGNVMDIIFELYNMHVESCKKINPVFYEELKKYHKVTEYLAATADKDEKDTQAFFKAGIEQGYFRPELNYNVLSKIMRLSAKYVVEHEDITQYESDFIFKNVIFVFFRGFCTIKGVEAVDKKLAELVANE